MPPARKATAALPVARGHSRRAAEAPAAAPSAARPAAAKRARRSAAASGVPQVDAEAAAFTTATDSDDAGAGGGSDSDDGSSNDEWDPLAEAARVLAGRDEVPRYTYSAAHGGGYSFPDNGQYGDHDGESFVTVRAARDWVKAAQKAAAELLTKPAAKQAASTKGKAGAKRATSASSSARKKTAAASEPQTECLPSGIVQHRLGQVSNRSKCNISACRNRNAVLGCQTCGIHLCSPECYNAHAFDGALLCGTVCAIFMEKSKLSQRESNPNKAHGKA